MQIDPSACTKRTVAELSASERDTLQNWVDRLSAKYEVVGYLNDGANPRTMAGSMCGGRGSENAAQAARVDDKSSSSSDKKTT